MRLYAGALFLCGNRQQTVGVNLEGYADTRCACGHRRNAAQGKFGQAAAVGNEFALALYDVYRHGGLAVFESSEVLRARGRNGGVARDDFLSKAAIGFQTERQGGNVQQQPFAVGFVAGKDICLYGGTECNHFVWVEVVQRSLSEEGGDRLLDVQHTGGAADHNHAFDVGLGHACVFQCLFDRLYGFLHQILGQIVKLLACNNSMDFMAV